jgi:hypothetical protein
MGVRSEYRRRFDSNAQATQAALAELDQEQHLAQEPAQEPAPEPRRPELGVVRHNASANGQHSPATPPPPWHDELMDGRELHYSASVQAPPSREPNALSDYSAPRPESVRLSVEQMALCKEIGCNPVDYAMHMLKMNEMIKRGDLQR